MTASSVLGKRKACDEPAGTIIEARVVLEDFWATESVQFPASAASNITDLFQEVQSRLSVAKRHTLAAQRLAAPKFLLQETSEKAPMLRESQFFPVRFTNNVSYRTWYNRNVLPGNASVLKCKVHLRTFACALREARDYDQTNEKSWFSVKYAPFEPSTKPDGGHTWEESPVDNEEYDDETIAAIKDAPATVEWFPERISNKAEEVKKDAAAAKKPIVATAEPVKEEKGSKDGGEGAEKATSVLEEDEEVLWDYSTEEEERMIEQEKQEKQRLREKRERIAKRFE